MTRTTNARIAGAAFLLYILIGVSQMVFFGGTTEGDGTAARLATMAQRATDVRLAIIFNLGMCMAALTVGVTLYAITREQDPDLALLALTCRLAEGITGAFFMPITLGLLAVATTAATSPPGAEPPHAVVSLVLAARSWNPVIAASFFAVGSAIFCWLLLRGRMIPAVLAWFGLIASVLLVVGLPLRLAGVVGPPFTILMWIPMAAFEIPLGFWLIAKGVAEPARPVR